MSDYCQPAPDREKRRRENASAMSFVHGLLTMVVIGAFMFVTGIAAASEDMSERPNEVYSERCGVGRCELLLPTESGGQP